MKSTRSGRNSAQIAARLHGAWLKRLRAAWVEANRDCLDGQLRAPVLRIDRDRRRGDTLDLFGRDDFGGRLGSWDRRGRILSVHERHIIEHAWHEVVATLRHEMAHQYVDEVLGGDRSAHGPRFAQTCRRLRITPEASGSPLAAEDDKATRILRRIRKLLALADSHNQHEAEAAMAAANTLLLRYNLSLPDAGPRIDYDNRIVGRSAAALPLCWKLVAGVLSEFFFVDCVWVFTYNALRNRDERVLELLDCPRREPEPSFERNSLTCPSCASSPITSATSGMLRADWRPRSALFEVSLAHSRT